MYAKINNTLMGPFLNLCLYTREQEALAYCFLSREDQLSHCC